MLDHHQIVRFPSEDQVERLQTVAGERGWTVAQVFTDRPVTAKKGLDRRPGETGADRRDPQRRDRQGAASGPSDRIGKSLIELVGFMETCRASSVSTVSPRAGTRYRDFAMACRCSIWRR